MSQTPKSQYPGMDAFRVRILRDGNPVAYYLDLPRALAMAKRMPAGTTVEVKDSDGVWHNHPVIPDAK